MKEFVDTNVSVEALLGGAAERVVDATIAAQWRILGIYGSGANSWHRGAVPLRKSSENRCLRDLCVTNGPILGTANRVLRTRSKNPEFPVSHGTNG